MSIIVYEYRLYISNRLSTGTLYAEPIFNIIVNMFRPIGIIVKTVTSIGGYTITGITFDFGSRKLATLEWIVDTINTELAKESDYSPTITIGTFEIKPTVSEFSQKEIDEIEAGFNPYIVAKEVLG